jgi:ribonuclease HII
MCLIYNRSVKPFPTLQLEKSLWEKGYLVIGIDEVGRGALAGPVGVGAVCYHPADDCSKIEAMGIHDSKLLSPLQRAKLQPEIEKHLLASSIQYSSVEIINKYGIVSAVEKAVRSAVREVQLKLQTKKPLFLLLDAFPVKNVRGIPLQNQQAIIQGDSKCISIASAAILAKQERDRMMSKLSTLFPSYSWHENKGYGTKAHLYAIQNAGATKWHRTLYIRNVLAGNTQKVIKM